MTWLGKYCGHRPLFIITVGPHCFKDSVVNCLCVFCLFSMFLKILYKSIGSFEGMGRDWEVFHRSNGNNVICSTHFLILKLISIHKDACVWRKTFIANNVSTHKNNALMGFTDLSDLWSSLWPPMYQITEDAWTGALKMRCIKGLWNGKYHTLLIAKLNHSVPKCSNVYFLCPIFECPWVFLRLDNGSLICMSFGLRWHVLLHPWRMCPRVFYTDLYICFHVCIVLVIRVEIDMQYLLIDMYSMQTKRRVNHSVLH